MWSWRELFQLLIRENDIILGNQRNCLVGDAELEDVCNYGSWSFDLLMSINLQGFFILNPILSDLCKWGLHNLEKNVAPSGNTTQASD